MSARHTMFGVWAMAMLFVAGCGTTGESTSESGGEATGDAKAVAQVTGDGTEFYQYVPKKKNKPTNPEIIDVKPAKVGEQKFTYPLNSPAPEVILDATVFSDKSMVFDGAFQEFRSDGKTRHAIGSFKNDHRDGKWTYFHPNGKVAKEVNYVDGRLDGSWTHFDENGVKLLDATYKNGKRHGTWTHYGPADKDGKQGVTQTMQFTDGVLDGSFVQYYANSQKRVEQRFVKGVPEGVQTQWYQDGTKYVEKSFVGGKQNGIETIWDAKGNIVKRREFRDGAPLRTTEEGKTSEAAKTTPASG